MTSGNNIDWLLNVKRIYVRRVSFILFWDKKFECTVWQVLLVGEDEYDSVAHLPIVDNPMQLLASLVDAISVRAVDNKYEALGAWKQLVVKKLKMCQ